LPVQYRLMTYIKTTFAVLIVTALAFATSQMALAKHIKTANSPMSHASPAAGDTYNAGFAQGKADATHRNLDQSIFDTHGKAYQDGYIAGYNQECLATPGNTQASCNDSEDAG